MTAILALVRKDLKLYINDRRALMIHLLVPVIVAAFFGALFGGDTGKGQTGKIDIALIQQDSSDIGVKIAAGLKSEPTLRVQTLTLDEARARVAAGKVNVAVVIPAGFGDAAGSALFGAGEKPALPLFYDPSQATVLAMVKGLLTKEVMQHVSAEMFNGKTGRDFTDTSLAQIEGAAGADPEQAALRDMLHSVRAFQGRQEQTRKAAGNATAGPGQGGLSMPFDTRDEAVSSGPAYNVYAHTFAGMGVQFILFMGIDLGIGLLTARRTGLWNRLLAAPVTQGQVLLSRTISGTIIAAGLLAAIFLCAVVIFGVEITNLPGFALVTLGFALMTATFGLMIAALGRTPEAARGIATFATLMIVMLGGAWVPSFIFPEWLQTLSLAMPARWAIDGFDAVTWRGLGIEAALRCTAVLIGFAALFGALAAWRFRTRARDA
ncbi:MAG TPA: ABC transporter permease [Pseudoduganella sp.]|jgi:ABC-2 type transport system permease protein